MNKPKAIVTVVNDLYSDRRVDKSCRELQQQGFDVTLLGRLLPDSPPMDERPYHTHRMSMLFHSGVLMYLELQIRLFFYLITHKGHFFWSNDLDTVLPCLIVAKIRAVPVIQDSHEYFTGVPELQHNPRKRKLWKKLEQYCYPRVDELITVNESIAVLFRSEYKRAVHVIRNVPATLNFGIEKSRQQLGIPEDKAMLLMQGAGINVERGGEELLQAMAAIDNAVLFIIGSGDVIPKLKKMASEERLEDKIRFMERMPWKELMQYTLHADLGFSLDKPHSVNYKYSLPNKLFDYIHTRTPVIVSDVVEVRKIVKEYDIGLILPQVDAETISRAINDALTDSDRYKKWQENIKFAATQLNWEQERAVLYDILKKYA